MSRVDRPDYPRPLLQLLLTTVEIQVLNDVRLSWAG